MFGVLFVFMTNFAFAEDVEPSDFRELQTGETMSNPEIAIIIESLGAGLIILFIVIFAIKKRKKPND